MIFQRPGFTTENVTWTKISRQGKRELGFKSETGINGTQMGPLPVLISPCLGEILLSLCKNLGFCV